MNKALISNPFESGITELTLQDIQNNLKKPIFVDYLDLDNVYEFLNTVSTSKGRSGFVTIKKETRKRSYEPIKNEDPDFKPKITTPRIIREKSPIASPLGVTRIVMKSSPKNASLVNLMTVEENKVQKVNWVKGGSKVQVKSPRQDVRKLGETQVRIKNAGKDAVESSRDRGLSPYALGTKSSGKLPLLQTSKKRISAIKLEKVRKKSKGRK